MTIGEVFEQALDALELDMALAGGQTTRMVAKAAGQADAG